MERKNGVESVKVVPGRRIIISTGKGSASIDELRQLKYTVLSNAQDWEELGWAYVADCSNVEPVTPAEAGVTGCYDSKNGRCRLQSVGICGR